MRGEFLMSVFVLERKYALQLPSSFADLDREEMEYVDGGALTWWQKGLVVAAVAAVSSAVIYTCGAILLAGVEFVLALGPVATLEAAVGAEEALKALWASVGIGSVIGIAVGNWIRRFD
jgi:hypothetical protein